MIMGKRLGDYEVLSELGRGGFATVYRARGPQGETVAVKVLTERATDDAYSRFAREERLLEALGEAEGFVPILATGVSEYGPFFVMPLLPGGTLRDRLEKQGTLEYEEALQLGRALATSIGWAHERGIVHRDLKPENILFAKDGRALIADLGIAKHFKKGSTTNSVSESITEQGVFLGTAHYMAPEHMDDSKSVGPRADVFALGALLYECVIGTPPFAGRNIQETIARITKGEYRRILEVKPETPLDLAYPIGTAINTNAQLRYENGFAFAQALGARIPQRARIQTTVQENPNPKRRRRSPVLWVLPVLLGGVMLLAGHGAPKPAPNGLAAVPSAATPAPPSTPKKPVVAKGWFGEPLPEGLQQTMKRPVYIFDTKKGLEIEFVYVPPGDFFMGAINGGQHEKPIHTHPMPRGYYIARTEVTWDQYRAFCRATGHALPEFPSWPITGMHPVVNVTWHDAKAFCDWSGLALPTEPEWEKAARGGEGTRHWPWGDSWTDGAANILDTSCPEIGDPGAKETVTDGYPYTAPVGSFARDTSPYRAVDMAGNVAEWTADRYSPEIYLEYSNGRVDPPTTGGHHVVRGGSWKESRFCATATFRGVFELVVLRTHIGFRPVLR